MPFLRLVIDGEVIWQGWTDDDIIMNQKIIIRPIPSAPGAFWESGDVTTDNFTFKTVQDKEIEIAATSEKEGPKYSAPTPAPIQQPINTPEPTPEEIADALEAAADLLLTEGWIQGDFQSTKAAFEKAEALRAQAFDPWVVPPEFAGGPIAMEAKHAYELTEKKNYEV